MSNVTVSIKLLDGTWITPSNVSGVSYVTTAPGGCASAQFTVDDADWIDRLGPQCPVVISDARTSQTLWSGFVKDDGRARSGADMVLTVDVTGTAQLLTEMEQWLPYAVQDLGQWVQDTSPLTNKTSGQAGAGQLPWHPQVSALVMSMPQGNINPLDCLRMSYQGFSNSTMTLAGLAGSVEAGVHNAGSSQYPSDWYFRVYWGNPGWGHTPIVHSANDISYETDFAALSGTGSSVPVQQQALEIEWKFQGVNGQANGYTTTSDSLWVGVWNVIVYGQANDRTATAWSYDPANNGGWLPHHIVEDLMSRLLASWVDMAPYSSVVSQESLLLIDQLDFSGNNGPADAQTVLDALVNLQPNYYYFVGPQRANGRAPLSWLPWPTDPKYQAPAWNVTYDASGSVQELCNQVVGVYTDAAGRSQTVTATADPNTFPDVASLNRTRQVVVHLDETIGSSSAAQQVVNAYLWEVATLPKGASATISEPILDLTNGSPVLPSMIQPGQLMLVPETGDTLRINEVDYDADSDTATVKLAEISLSLDQLIAGLGQRYLRKGRKRR